MDYLREDAGSEIKCFLEQLQKIRCNHIMIQQSIIIHANELLYRPNTIRALLLCFKRDPDKHDQYVIKYSNVMTWLGMYDRMSFQIKTMEALKYME